MNSPKKQTNKIAQSIIYCKELAYVNIGAKVGKLETQKSQW